MDTKGGMRGQRSGDEGQRKGRYVWIEKGGSPSGPKTTCRGMNYTRIITRCEMMGEEGGYAWTEKEDGCEWIENEGGVHDTVFYPIVRC